MVFGAWNDPPIVEAPSYADRNTRMKLAVSEDITGKRSGNYRHTPLFMLWAHVYGQLPPINLVSMIAESEPTPTLLTLDDSTACFQGIERQHLNDARGDNVVVYVLKPLVTIEFATSMTCMARAMKPAVPFVLTVQVVLADTLLYPVNGVDGLITRLEPVACDGTNGDLPIEHETRYRHRCW